MKVVFCELIWAARRMQIGSPIVAAHTSGAIRFPVRRVIVREMTVRYVRALVGPPTPGLTKFGGVSEKQVKAANFRSLSGREWLNIVVGCDVSWR